MQSAGLIWAEAISGDDDDYGSTDQPEFHRPADVATWLAQLEESDGDAAEALEAAGCRALLAWYVGDMTDDEVEWTSPTELHDAADRLANLIRQGDASVKVVVGAYVDESETGLPTSELLVSELEQLKVMARWAKERGKTRLAIEIG